MNELGWPRKLPIVSLLVAAAIVAVPFILASESRYSERLSGTLYESAREEARTFLVRNPKLEVDAAGALILGPEWLAQLRADVATSEANSGTIVELPTRMLARSQARLDRFVANAYALRKQSDLAWQYGVLDARTPAPNYFIHAFVSENKAAVALSIAVVLLAGIALEMAWGSLIFAAFTMAVIPLTAEGYRFLDATGGIPWSGAAGLAGAFMGAYFIRGLGGHFTIPGWILLPAWIGIEAFVVRGFWIDDLGSVPWATFCASVGLGALVAGALRMANVESKIVSRSADLGPNPIVARAARLRSDGDPYQAFDLIQAAWRDDPSSEEIAEAFFSIAVEVGQPEAAAVAIVPNLERALRKGEIARAVDYWFPLATNEAEVELDPTAAVKLGEALLDAGHPKEALFTLRGALDLGISAIHAARIVKVARDLDEALARRAATIALGDASLDAKLRAELEPIVAGLSEPSPILTAPAAEETEPESGASASRSQLDRRVEAEHQAIDTTAFPIEADLDVDRSAEGGAVGSDPNEARLAEQSLDSGALSMESLSADPPEIDGSLEGEKPAADFAVENSGDVLSHWNDRNSLSSTAVMSGNPTSGGDSADDALLESSEFECHDDDFDFGSSDTDTDFFSDPLAGDSDTDFTPLMDAELDATGEMTSPLISDETVTATMSSSSAEEAGVFDQPTMFFETPNAAVAMSDDIATGTQSESGASDPARLRPLKALDAVPISMSEEWIEIDASPRGKSKLPFSRIQTLAMAAVEGLGNRPVLVVDCVLSESNRAEDTLKSIRFRSDRFDPCSFQPDAPNPLVALTQWVSRLQAGSNANCLPSRDILHGRFARFASIEAYEREVLSASGEDKG